jgi:hypothetical protein
MHDKRSVAVLAGIVFIGLGVRGIVTGKVLIRGGTISRAKEPRWFWLEVSVWVGGGAFMLLTALLWL